MRAAQLQPRPHHATLRNSHAAGDAQPARRTLLHAGVRSLLAWRPDLVADALASTESRLRDVPRFSTQLLLYRPRRRRGLLETRMSGRGARPLLDSDTALPAPRRLLPFAATPAEIFTGDASTAGRHRHRNVSLGHSGNRSVFGVLEYFYRMFPMLPVLPAVLWTLVSHAGKGTTRR